jgi:outer membrane protein assembly factor BamB
MRRVAYLLIAVSVVVYGFQVRGEHWPQWRGPNFDGSTSETNLPDTLDPASTLAWKVELPGPSSGTPVVFGDRIFLGSLDKNSKLLALCLSRADGKELWRHEVGLGAMKNERNDLASPSPITDGKTVWYYYGTGDLAAFDIEGKPLWARNIEKDHGKFNMLWIYSASPLLFNGKMYIPVLHRDTPVGRRGGPRGAPAPAEGSMADSYLLCIDPVTGKDIWRIVRPTDAVQEAREAYTTPMPIQVGGKWQIVINGGDHVTGHDAESGKELWRSPTYNTQTPKRGDYRTVASATPGMGLVFASGPKESTLFAVEPNDGSSPDAKLAWNSQEQRTDVCAPLFYQGKLFILNGDRKTVSCLDPKSGQPRWSVTLGGRPVFRASPTGADGKIYCMNEGADTWVISAADGKMLGQSSLGTETPARASVVAAEGEVFVRTADHLYAFAKK